MIWPLDPVAGTVVCLNIFPLLIKLHVSSDSSFILTLYIKLHRSAFQMLIAEELFRSATASVKMSLNLDQC